MTWWESTQIIVIKGVFELGNGNYQIVQSNDIVQRANNIKLLSDQIVSKQESN